MDHIVTLTIPDPIYRTAEATAKATNQSIDQVIHDKLQEAFQPQPRLHVSRNRAAMLREMAAYEAMHAELLANHVGDYVAIYQGQLVDSDVDEEALLQRRRRNFPGEVVFIRQVEADPQPELVYRSPRFA